MHRIQAVKFNHESGHLVPLCAEDRGAGVEQDLVREDQVEPVAHHRDLDLPGEDQGVELGLEVGLGLPQLLDLEVAERQLLLELSRHLGERVALEGEGLALAREDVALALHRLVLGLRDAAGQRQCGGEHDGQGDSTQGHRDSSSGLSRRARGRGRAHRTRTGPWRGAGSGAP